MNFNLDLDSDTVLKLRAMAQAEGRSVERFTQDVLEAHARKYKRPPIPGLGEFDSGGADTSERVDEILREAATKGRWQ